MILLKLLILVPFAFCGGIFSEDANILARKAIANGDIETLKKLIVSRGEHLHPKTLNEYGMVAAVNAGRPDMAKVLIEANSDPNAQFNQAMIMAADHESLKSLDGYAVRSAIERDIGDTNYKIVELLLKDGRTDPDIYDNLPLIDASSKRGHSEIVALLLKDDRVDPRALGSGALIEAARNGHTEVVKLFIKDGRASLTADHNFPIRIAAKSGYTEIVRALLETGKVDPADNFNAAIIEASEMGHSDIVRLLLADPIKVNAAQSSNLHNIHVPDMVPNLAIKWAHANRHTEVVALLSQDTKVAAIEFVENPNAPPLSGSAFVKMLGSREWMNREYNSLLFSYPAIHDFFAYIFNIDLESARAITSIDQLIDGLSSSQSQHPLSIGDVNLKMELRRFLLDTKRIQQQ